MESGVATPADRRFRRLRRRSSTRFVFRSGFIMKPMFAKAKTQPKRVIYAEGEDERVLRADAGGARGEARAADPDRPPGGDRDALKRYGLVDQGRAAISSSSTPRTIRATATMSRPISRSPAAGVTPDAARTLVRTNTTVIAALAVRARRGRRDDLRPRGPLLRASAAHPRHHRARARRAAISRRCPW